MSSSCMANSSTIAFGIVERAQAGRYLICRLSMAIYALLVAQSLHGVDLCGPPCGHEAGEDSYGDQNRASCSGNQRVIGLDLEEQAGEDSTAESGE